MCDSGIDQDLVATPKSADVIVAAFANDGVVLGGTDNYIVAGRAVDRSNAGNRWRESKTRGGCGTLRMPPGATDQEQNDKETKEWSTHNTTSQFVSETWWARCDAVWMAAVLPILHLG